MQLPDLLRLLGLTKPHEQLSNGVRILDFALLFAALLCFALPAVAQDRAWRVGLLSAGSDRVMPGTTMTWRAAVLQSLERQGFRAGTTVEMVDRYANGNADRLPGLAREIAAAKVDVVIAITDDSVRAVLAATRTTPIVMVSNDPVAAGFVASLARPGGRITGLAFQVIDGDAKRLELLSAALPAARHFGYLLPPGPPRAAARVTLLDAASRLNIELTLRPVERMEPPAYRDALAVMRAEGAAAVLLASTQAMSSAADRIVPLAEALGLPTMCEWAFMAHAGCVLAYGHDLDYGRRRIGEYVARVLRGAAPADLPVEQPDTWRLVVNLRAAARVGLVLPDTLLDRADEIIE